MNESVLIDPPETFVKKAVELLKEYQSKLLRIKEQFRSLWEQLQTAESSTLTKSKVKEDISARKIWLTEFQVLEQSFYKLRPALNEFSQQVSGMVDQGRVTPLDRSELRLRLTELESAVTQMHSVIDAYRPR